MMLCEEPVGAIDISDTAAELGGAKEIMRVFIPQPGEAVGGIFVDPHEQFSPFMFGMLLADLVNHGARAYAHKFGVDEAATRLEISQGMKASDEAHHLLPESEF